MRFGGYGEESSPSGTTNEKNELRSRADKLQAELESIRQRLDEIEATSKTR
jgi:predicted nuclease with TOPRIM domain